MFVLCNRNVIFREGDLEHHVPAGFIGDVPEWVTKTWLFSALAADRDIVVPEGRSDKEIAKTEKPKKK